MKTQFDEAISADDWFRYTEALSENLLLALDQLEVMGTECALNGDHSAAQFLAGIRAAVSEFARVHLQANSARDREESILIHRSTGDAACPINRILT